MDWIKGLAKTLTMGNVGGGDVRRYGQGLDRRTTRSPPVVESLVIASPPADSFWSVAAPALSASLPLAAVTAPSLSPPMPPTHAMAQLSLSGNTPPDPGHTETLRQYMLICHARSLAFNHGIWFFSLESLSGESILDAESEEEGDLNRLSLLAAVRGLESIDGRGLVSLISNNRYLIRSLDKSLPRWRESNYVWEQFGRKMPVQNADLWRRIDRTLSIHRVTASLLQSTQLASGAVSSGVGHDSRQAPVIRVDRGHSVHAPASGGNMRFSTGDESDSVPIVTRRGRYRAADMFRD